MLLCPISYVRSQVSITELSEWLQLGRNRSMSGRCLEKMCVGACEPVVLDR